MPEQEEQLDERLAIERLTEFGDAELDGVRRLIEKIVSFGGEPTTKVAALRFHAGTQVDFMRRATG